MSVVTVLGEGAFGTAIALLLARNGHSVRWWCYHEHAYCSIKEKRRTLHAFSDKEIPESIIPFHDLKDAVFESPYIIEAIPTKFLRSIVRQVRDNNQPEPVWVILSKGIEQDTLLFPSHIIDNVYDAVVKKVVISGPSYAHDIVENQLVMVNGAGSDARALTDVAELMQNDTFRVVAWDDMLGLQICGALKNCLALLIGMLDGAGHSESTQAVILVRALEELKHAVHVLGGQENTVYSFAGIGDIVLTAYGKKSRNREVGHRLGAGEKLDVILASMHAVPESITTLKAVQQLCVQKNISLPLLQKLYCIVFEHASLSDSLAL